MVRAADCEHELCVSTTQYGAPVEQTAFEKRLTERQGAGLGDDRFVQVEKCGAPGHAARIWVVRRGQSRPHRRVFHSLTVRAFVHRRKKSCPAGPLMPTRWVYDSRR